MKTFNINDYIYIQITDLGWEHLEKTVGKEYIEACIKTPSYEKNINNELWYKLQANQVFDILPCHLGVNILYSTNIMFDESDLK